MSESCTGRFLRDILFNIILIMGKITKNFSQEEFEHSNTALKCGFANHVPTRLHENMRKTLEVLQMARDILGSPIYITSGYRSRRLNELVAGAKNSYHMSARAVDVRCDDNDSLNAILASLPHVELIYHYPNFIHFAV